MCNRNFNATESISTIAQEQNNIVEEVDFTGGGATFGIMILIFAVTLVSVELGKFETKCLLLILGALLFFFL